MAAWIGYLLTGGFLAGYRSKIVAALLALDVIAKYMLGDIGVMDLLKYNWQEIATSIGVLASSVHKTTPA